MDRTVLEVKLQPGASRDEIVGLRDGVLMARVKAPAEGGKANEALVRLLCRTFSLSPQQIKIIRGRTQRRKLIGLYGVKGEDLQRLILRKLP